MESISDSILIKNMVCDRCIRAVQHILDHHHIKARSVKLGEVILDVPVSSEQLQALDADLQAEGFQRMEDYKGKLVTAIKNLLIRTIHYGDLSDRRENFSDLIARSLHKDYHYLSALFSEAESLTIEQFIILQKIEKVKELLVYGEKTLSDIAFDMGYSSVAHLSSQFKKVTGFTPSAFRKAKDHKRVPLDKL